MTVAKPTTPSSRTLRPSLGTRLLATLVVTALVAHTAGAARAKLRALPPLDRQEATQSVHIDKEQDLEADSFPELHEAGDTLDILVPPYIWGLGSLMDEQDVMEIQLPPSERLSLPSLPSILPHFNTSCSCQQWKCSCCARVEITPLRKNKTGCASLSYVQERVAIVVQLSINNRTLIERDLISGSNPPPLCLPIPQLPIVTMCIRLSNITFTNDAKVQACAALEVGLVFTSPLIRLRFGCLRIGHGGVSWSSTPAANALNFHSVEDAQTAFQQFAAALNSTDNEQFQLLQSLLRQQDFYEKPSPTVLPVRNRKMSWS